MSAGVAESVEVPEPPSLKQFRMDKSQRISLMMIALALAQVAKYIGDGAYFVGFQMRFPAQYPKGNATYADWYLADWFDRLPVHLQNLLNRLGAHITWFAAQGAPAWWEADRHLVRGIIIGLVAAALVQNLTAGVKVRPLGKAGLLLSPVLVIAIVLPLTALGVYLLTERMPQVLNVGAYSSVPYVGDWLGKDQWQPIILGFVVLWPAKRVIRRVGATLQAASIDDKLLRGETEKPYWRFIYLPNWLQRFRYTQGLRDARLHTPENHGRLIGTIITWTVILSVFLFIVGILVTTVGPASHH